MKIPAELLPVLQITLPIILAILGAAWIQNKRIDDLRSDTNRQFDQVLTELRAIRMELGIHGERLARLEQRDIPPLVRR